MKTAVVTGANGFLGSYVVQTLCQKNYIVYAIVRGKESNVSNISNKNVRIIYCDIFEIDRLPDIIQERCFDSFYHLAWCGSSGISREDYILQINNAAASAKSIDVAKNLGCKRFIGTGSVAELMYRDYLHLDNCQPNMVACYAIGKIAAEYICRCIATKKEIEFVWGYLSNIYGIGDMTNNFVNYLLESYLNGKEPILTAGEQKADFTYVSDIAKGIVSLGEEGLSGHSYYVGYANPKALKEYVFTIRNAVNPQIPSGLGKKEFYGLSPCFEKIDIKKLENDTSFHPVIGFEQGIQLTLEWIKNGRRSPWIV